MFLLALVTSTLAPEASAAPALLVRQGLVIPTSGGFDSMQAAHPSVLIDGTLYKMWYFGCDPSYFCQIGYATSVNGRNWSKQGAVLSPTLPQEGSIVAYPEVLRTGGTYRMWYTGFNGSHYRIFAAESPNGLAWTKRGVVLDAGPPGAPDENGVGLSRVLFDGSTYRMWYTTTQTTPSSILLATSSDGWTWSRQGVVLTSGPFNESDYYGVQAAAVVPDGAQYGMIYTGYSDAYTGRMFYASSPDGSSWSRLGLALDILPPQERLIGGPSILAQSDGSWWVYYTARSGVSDLQIFLATGPSPLPTPEAPGATGFLVVLGLLAPVLVAITTAAVVLATLAFFLLRSTRGARRS